MNVHAEYLRHLYRNNTSPEAQRVREAAAELDRMTDELTAYRRAARAMTGALNKDDAVLVPA